MDYVGVRAMRVNRGAEVRSVGPRFEPPTMRRVQIRYVHTDTAGGEQVLGEFCAFQY